MLLKQDCFNLPTPLRISRSFIFICLIIITLLFPIAAFANVAPPVPRIWFVFTYATSQPVSLQGAQLAGCSTPACEQPVLLLQQGICDRPGCLDASPTLGGLPNRFECAAKTCLAVIYNYEGQYFKLIGQFSDGVRSSPVLSPPHHYWATWTWRVTVSDSDLSVTTDTTSPQPDRFGLFLIGLVLTLVVELTVAALYLLRLKANPSLLRETLIIIGLINLLTFPVVWFFFPSLTPFHPGPLRAIGNVTLVLALLYGAALVYLRLSPPTKLRRIGFGLTIASLPLALLCIFFTLFLSAYGETPPFAAGVSPLITIPASEIFAFSSEAILLTLLSRRALSLGQAGLLSLLMNGASFLVGLLVIPVW